MLTFRIFVVFLAWAASAAWSRQYFSGRAELIVKLRSAYHAPHHVRAFCSDFGLRKKFEENLQGIIPVASRRREHPASLQRLLKQDRRVEYVERDMRWQAIGYPEKEATQPLNAPNDRYFKEQWGLYNQDNGRADIKVLEAWAISTGSRTIVVGILDSGIDYLHPDLRANIWRNPGEALANGADDERNGFIDDVYGWNFVENNRTPNHNGRGPDPVDRAGHGTHVAGTVGAEVNNHIGVAGVCHNVRLMAVKGLSDLGWGYTSDLLAGIIYAVDNGAHVINASWGSFGYSQALRDAIAYAASKNVIFVAAAGNYAADNDQTPFYPASYDVPNILSVGAIDKTGRITGFSHFGKESVDLFAPGRHIWSTLPDNAYVSWTGTSMAAPHVAGAVALLRGFAPDLSYDTYIHAVLASADRGAEYAERAVSDGRLNVYGALKALNPKKKYPDHVIRYLMSIRK
ncbi:MAG: S8 family serine peptidase [Chitinivibrionales bacterium]|nr:S8 family serine peptidase [Chitinivibrionales bacterium]